MLTETMQISHIKQNTDCPKACHHHGSDVSIVKGSQLTENVQLEIHRYYED